MDCLMFMERQGVNLAPIVKELEKRIEVLENVVKALQEKSVRIGRPPKEKNEPTENKRDL